jgi:hypothetical protein
LGSNKVIAARFAYLYRKKMMHPYKNLSKNAGILAYDFAGNDIIVKFTNNVIYLYTEKENGKEQIEKMKKLAEKGEGLTTYINQNIKHAQILQ